MLISMLPYLAPANVAWTMKSAAYSMQSHQMLPFAAAMDDCEVGAGKKACKNCTCGRADAEAAVQKVDLSQDMLENPQSACGSVSLPWPLPWQTQQLHAEFAACSAV